MRKGVAMKNIIIKVALLLFAFSVARAQWVQTSGNGISGSTVLSFVTSGTTIFAGTLNKGIYSSTDDGANWDSVGNVDVPTFILANSGGLFFAGTRHGVYISTNSGTSWNAASNGLPDTVVGTLAVSGGYIFAGTIVGVFRSSDSGTSWNAVNTGLANTRVYSLAAVNGYLLAGTYGGGIFRSSDNGAHWIAANTGLGTDTLVIVLASINGNVYATAIPGQFLSTDDGANWIDISIPIPLDPPPQGATEAYAVSGGNIFAGRAGNGVWLTTNTGGHWADVSNGLTDSTILSLTVSGNYLLAGTDGDGVWRRPLSQMTAVDEQMATAPARSSLVQNYPNPFTTSTRIILPPMEMNAQRVSITDMLGKEIAVFPKESFNSMEWAPSASTPAGTYFLVVKTPTGIASKPLVLLR